MEAGVTSGLFLIPVLRPDPPQHFLPTEPFMARPIWTGAISFGLLNIPVQLMSAERRVDLRFHMLDSRDQKTPKLVL